MPTKTVTKGITRFDIGNRGGYMVRISRRGNRVNRYFADTTWGGKRKALAAAKQAYADLLEELGPAESATRGRLTSRNTSGIVGVHLAYTLDKRYSGAEYYAYCASWITEDGHREKASFAWKKYGEDRSLQLAIIARERQLTDHDQVVAIYERSGAAKKSKHKAKASLRKTSKKVASKKPAKKSVKRTAAKASTTASKKTGQRPVKKTVKKSIKKATKKAAKKSVKRAVKKAVKRR